MNQQQITDEVKRLAKEIAKYWRMEIYKGCWVKIGGKIQLVSNCNNNYFYTGCNYVKNQWTNRKGSGIPIPSISDCLEKLRELKLRYIFHAWGLDKILVSLIDDEKGCVIVDQVEAPTLHEALLSALLEVVKK